MKQLLFLVYAFVYRDCKKFKRIHIYLSRYEIGLCVTECNRIFINQGNYVN
jgi:hypothetical protein